MIDQRIYVAVAGTVQVGTGRLRTVIQPPGRQIAQAAHVVSKLRHVNIGLMFPETTPFIPITTIVLQARDSSELSHLWGLLTRRVLKPVQFKDTNQDAYGPEGVVTAIAVLATQKQISGIMDYLPLWGAT